MASYGQAFDPDYNPATKDIYTLFVSYFNNPDMTKLKNIPNPKGESYSMYIAKVHTLLGIEFRYIIAIVSLDKSNIGTREKLSRLKWLSLQTRTLTEDHDLKSHYYIPRKLIDLDKKIILRTKDETKYVYSVNDLPITITLLPQQSRLNKSSSSVDNKPSLTDYTSTGSVVPAIETYNTIITWKVL